MKTHLLRVPYEGANARRDCKGTDDGPNTENPQDVTCERCIEHARNRDDYAWRDAECAKLDKEIGTETDDGYKCWHPRASEMCYAETERVHIQLHGHIEVEWYCKLTPIPARFRNHGWHVKVCYRAEGMTGYNHFDEWMPMDAHPHELIGMVNRNRRALLEAIEAGFRVTLAKK